jgi:hypothetical protein
MIGDFVVEILREAVSSALVTRVKTQDPVDGDHWWNFSEESVQGCRISKADNLDGKDQLTEEHAAEDLQCCIFRVLTCER